MSNPYMHASTARIKLAAPTHPHGSHFYFLGIRIVSEVGHAVLGATPLRDAKLPLLHCPPQERAKRATSRSVKSFNGLLLKFNGISEGFKKARQIFQVLDSNHDGRIDIEELKRGAPVLGLNPDDNPLLTVFAAADIDSS